MSDDCKATVDLILEVLTDVEGADHIRQLFEARKAANEATDKRLDVVDEMLACLADGFVYATNAFHWQRVLTPDQMMTFKVLVFNLNNALEEMEKLTNEQQSDDPGT